MIKVWEEVILNYRNPLGREQVEKLKKVSRITGYIVLSIFILISLILFVFHFFTEYIWMGSLGYSEIFTTVLWNKVILATIGFLLFAVSIFFTLYWIHKSYTNHFARNQLPKILLEKKKVFMMIIGLAIVIGIIGSSITQGLGWERMLKFVHQESFGQADPFFDLDISFYMFVLPFLKFGVFLLLGLSIFIFIIEIVAYSVFNMYRVNRTAQLHLGVTVAVIGLLLACIHLLAPYETLLTNSVNLFQDSVVYGLSYTDDKVNVPKAYVLAGAAVISLIWMIVVLARGSRLEALIAPVIFYLVLLVGGQAISIGVQNFVVSPNEFTKESPYLEHNLKFTRDAYQLTDIEEMEHPGNESLDADMVERNQQTIDNIRINDVTPLLEVYNQVQTFRTYYDFKDVDIDRYEIDGNYEQVFVGARELSTDDLPDQAQTWVNRYLRYTHGYGVTMSHVNRITSQGQPEYMMKDIPSEGIMDVERPQIYFGEGDYPNVIANSKVEEFDYPSGEENVPTRFDADTGIAMKGINRLLFSINEGSFRMFVSDQITKESQYLETRNIMDRVKRIAPFFQYDTDPYIFIREDGSLAWIIDAYLSSERYPYSEPYDQQNSYIRNSAKVVVDAYTGEVDFYVVDPDDPLLKTYDNIFPGLLTEEIPEDVQEHFRYPENLFSIQAEMYGTYHMSNLEVFYNREDFWEFPTEKYLDEDIEMEPYYITMKMPESDQEEFILMQPYTPKKRQNMIAWIGVRNDGDHYGEMFLHRFPKQKNVYGPQQIENRINQDSTISQQLNLWSQGGSEIIRGNLLAIPIEDTVFYVEPIYIKSSNKTSLPEVKQIVLAYGEEIVMEPTFDEALDKMLQLIDPDNKDKKDKDEEKDEDQEEAEVDEPEDLEDPMIESEEALRDLADLFDDYQQAMSDREWEKAAKIMTEIEQEMEAYE